MKNAYLLKVIKKLKEKMKARKKLLENTREMEIIEGRGREEVRGKSDFFFHKSASPLQKFFIIKKLKEKNEGPQKTLGKY